MIHLHVVLEQAKLIYNGKNQDRGCPWMVLGWELIGIDWEGT